MKKLLEKIKITVVVIILTSMSLIRVVALDINRYDEIDTFSPKEITKEFEVAAKAVEAINITEKQIKSDKVFKDYDEVYAGVWLDE